MSETSKEILNLIRVRQGESADLEISEAIYTNAKLLRHYDVQPEAGEIKKFISTRFANSAYSEKYIIESLYGRSVSGDGRAVHVDFNRADGRLKALNLKGLRTPLTKEDYDGQMSLFEALRELVATEYLAAAGIPCTRTLAILAGSNLIKRDFDPQECKNVLLLREAQSFIRIGHVQFMQQHLDDKKRLREYVLYVNDRLGIVQSSAELKATPEEMLIRHTVRNSARLVARWTLTGFIHGTLNTSHLMLSGESVDHGPFNTTEHYDLEAAPAAFDPMGIYSYGQQPKTVFWLLVQLINCFKENSDYEHLQTLIHNYKTDLNEEMVSYFFQILNIRAKDFSADKDLLTKSLVFLKQSRVSFAEFYSCNHHANVNELSRVPEYGELQKEICTYLKIGPSRIWPRLSSGDIEKILNAADPLAEALTKVSEFKKSGFNQDVIS